MERKKEDRSFWVYIGLSLVTCGIYGIIFMWNFVKDLNEVRSGWMEISELYCSCIADSSHLWILHIILDL